MKRNLLKTARRLAMAGIFSGMGFVATKYWYDSVKTKDAPSNATAIARVIDTRNEVQRKRAQRTIWQGIDGQMELGAGDSVRTGFDGGAKIEFVKSKAVIDLDPDSLVVIEEKQGKIAIDFLKGNLFVKNGEGDGSLTVVSGEKSIDLSKGDVALGRGESGALVQTDLSGTGPVQLGGFKVLMPRPFATVYIDPAKPADTYFAWAPLKLPADQTSDQVEVRLQVGSSPTEMRDVASKTFEKRPNMLGAPLKVGVQYWRLVAFAKDANGGLSKSPILTSTPVKLDLRPRTPPTAIFPLASAHVRMRPPAETSVTFRWSNTAQLPNIRFELFEGTGPNPRLVHSANFTNRDSQLIYDLQAGGDFKWRVSGVGANAQIDLPGAFVSFNASTASDLAPPTLIKPANNDRLPIETVRASGLFLVWKPISDAVGYKVTFRNATKSFTRETQTNSISLNDIARGEMSWSVIAVGDDGALSKASDTWRFRIDEVRPIEWTNLSTPDTYWYVGQTPQADLMWNTKGFDEVKTWRLRVARSGDLLTQSAWQTVVSGKSSQKFEKDDEYAAELEGLNPAGATVARSARRKFSVKLLPIPQAPVFADAKSPGAIQARGSGDADFSWKPVESAVGYAIRLTSTTGIEQEFETAKTQSRLDQLRPGNYTLVVYAKDSYGRRGPASIQRPVSVPTFNDRKAPRLSTVKVK